MSYIEAVIFLESWFTAWYNLLEQGELQGNQRVLIHGGSGGMGFAAIQLPRSIGAEVFTTVSTREKAKSVAYAGAYHVVLYPKEDFAEYVII